MRPNSQSKERLLESTQGLPIAKAIVRLISSLDAIAEVSFVKYRPAPGLDERLSKSADTAADIRELAENLRREYGIPFWDAILAICMKRGDIPNHYVDLAMLHDHSVDETTTPVEVKHLSEELIELMANDLDEGTALAFSSNVRLQDGGEAHIPLMDFRCPPSVTNSEIVRRALKAMGQNSGVLAQSGRSYHFYGLALQSRDEWVRFLAMAMLFSPIVDVRYVAHRLVDGACRLRISSSRGKAFTPIVSEVF